MHMSQDELKHKIQQFYKTYEYSNLITIDENGYPKGRMMENMPLGDDLVFWFATGAGSSKVAEVKKNGKASVFVYRPADHGSINVLGEAEVVTSDTIRAEKWKEKWTAFWKQGPTDPNYVLIKVAPKKIIYLDFAAHNQEVLDC
jgi:general stress protein 26